jgi:Zn-dependent protease with chaperone function
MSNAEVVTKTVKNAPISSIEKSGASPSNSFSGEIESTSVSLGYVIGLSVVAIGMVLLPLLYLGFIIIAAILLFLHITKDIWILEDSYMRPLIKFILYCGPIVAGFTLIFFMVKPFFARPRKESSKFTLKPEDEPELFAFINQICKQVNAPPPKRVDVDCRINASASFENGFSGMRRRDLVLTIGLPLVAGLNIQQFGGVLAHEFGHFTQGAGMSLTYLIQSINFWFHRVVHERDEWDYYLESATQRLPFQIRIIFYIARGCVAGSRKLLMLLMKLGHGMSCFMSRQMEYDADSYQVKLAGGRAFTQTFHRLRELTLADQLTQSALRESWQNNRLPDNLPAFISHKTAFIPADIRKAFEEATAGRKTGVFDTHPAHVDRIRAAEALKQTGILHQTDPAANLFTNFDSLSKAITRFYYENILNLSLTSTQLIPQEEILKQSVTSLEAAQVAQNFICGLNLGLRPVLLPTTLPPLLDRTNAISTLKAAPKCLEDLTRQTQAVLDKLQSEELSLRKFVNAFHLLQANFKIDGADFGLKYSSLTAAKEAISSASNQIQSLSTELQPFQKQLQLRLLLGLQLLHAPEIGSKVSDAASLQTEVASMLPAFSKLAESLPLLEQITRRLEPLLLLAKNRPLQPEHVDSELDCVALELKNLLKEVRTQISTAIYPFPHAKGQITVAEFAQSENLPSNKIEAIYQDATTHLDRLIPLYYKLLHRLMAIALKVEASL